MLLIRESVYCSLGGGGGFLFEIFRKKIIYREFVTSIKDRKLNREFGLLRVIEPDVIFASILHRNVVCGK